MGLRRAWRESGEAAVGFATSRNTNCDRPSGDPTANVCCLLNDRLYLLAHLFRPSLEEVKIDSFSLLSNVIPVVFPSNKIAA